MVLSEEEKRERRKKTWKKYRENNREKIKKRNENNKEYYKEWRENNKEKIKEYRLSETSIKSNVITKWKQRGLICEDYDSLYCHYSNATECDNCNITFGEKGDGSGTFKCMDHDHETGKFRNFLCCKCNVIRE